MKRHTFLRMALPAWASTAFRPVGAQGSAFRIGLTPVILADQAAFPTRWSEYLSRRLDSTVTFANSGWPVAQAQLHAAGLCPRDLKKSLFAHGRRNVTEAVAAWHS